MSVFYATRNVLQFWADPTVSAVRSTFLAEEEAQHVEILPHPKFWPFLGRPLEYVRFHPILNLSHSWAPSLVTLLASNMSLTPEHPEHIKGFSRFVKTRTILFVPPQCLSLLFSFCLSWFSSTCCFLCLLLFFVPGNSSWLSFFVPASMVLDIVEGQGRGRGQKRPKFNME